MSISVDIRKDFGGFTLQVAFEAENEVLGLLGASGCGKSMTLKCIAGVVTPDEGRIVLDGVTLFDSKKGINLRPQDRHVGLLFQNYALFPNMNVRQNIMTGLCRMKDAKEKDRIVRDIMDRPFECTREEWEQEKHPQMYGVHTVLALAADEIRRYGYRKSGERDSTRDAVTAAVKNRTPPTEEGGRRAGRGDRKGSCVLGEGQFFLTFFSSSRSY